MVTLLSRGHSLGLNKPKLQIVEGAPPPVIAHAREFHLLGQSCWTTEGLQRRCPVCEAVRVWVRGRVRDEAVPLIGSWRLHTYDEVLCSPELDIST